MNADGQALFRRQVLDDDFTVVARHAWGVASPDDPSLTVLLARAQATERRYSGIVFLAPKLLREGRRIGLPQDQEARLRGLVRFRLAANGVQLGLLRDVLSALGANGARAVVAGGLADVLGGTTPISQAILNETEIALAPFCPDAVATALVAHGWTLRGETWERPVAPHDQRSRRLFLTVWPRLRVHDMAPATFDHTNVAGLPWTDLILAACVAIRATPGHVFGKRQSLDRLHGLLLGAGAEGRYGDLLHRARLLQVERALSDTVGLLREAGGGAFAQLSMLETSAEPAELALPEPLPFFTKCRRMLHGLMT